MNIIGIIFVLVVGSTMSFAYAQEIPGWVKNNVSWWADGIIDDQEFIRGIQFLITEEILIVPPTNISEEKSTVIPDWIKNNGKWWADGIITDKEFLNNIQFLIANGILSVESSALDESEEEPEPYQVSGKFSDGDFFHRTSGMASIEFSADVGGTLHFDQRFSTVNGPDLFVYLATDNSANDFVNVGRLQSSSGEQSYSIPPDTDLEKYDNVLVWCRAFGVLFGNAELSPSYFGSEP
ncbi:MAG: DM13 domain-containing protein [Nitrosopumilus sp.]